MFSKKELLEILAWMHGKTVQDRGIYLPMQIPVTGVRDYTWGDIVRAVRVMAGDSDVVRGYEKVRELLTLRIIESETLELPIKTKFIEEFLAAVKVGDLSEGRGEERLSDEELEKRMESLGWKRI